MAKNSPPRYSRRFETTVRRSERSSREETLLCSVITSPPKRLRKLLLVVISTLVTWPFDSLMDHSPFKIEQRISSSGSSSSFERAGRLEADDLCSGGENISSLSVESRLTTHPDVSEVAVVARADEKWGERPHAFVVLIDPKKWHGKSEQFSEELKAFSKGLLPGFARPAWVEVVDALEKTTTGKVSKKTLRDQLKARK